MSANRETKIRELQVQLGAMHDGVMVQNRTLSSIAEQWLLREKMSVKQSTYAKYRTNLNNHILPQLGSLPVTDLNSMMVNTYIQYLKEDGRSDGKGGLSAKYVRDLYTILRGIVRYAELEYSFPSAIKNCRIPPKGEYKSVALSRREQRRLEEYVKEDLSDSRKLGVLLCLYTGLRVGEICALQWKHIHLDTDLLEVRQTVQRIQNPDREGTPKTFLIIGPPKSKTSIRAIPIPTFLHDLLKKQQRTGNDEAYFLTNRTDQIMEPRNYQYHFKNYMKELHMEWIHFHNLRHTFATRAIESGMDMKSLSEMLGHAGVGITMDRYVHSSVEEKKRQIEKLCM